MSRDELRKAIDDAVAKAKTPLDGSAPLNSPVDIDIGISHDMLGRVVMFFAAPAQWVSLGPPEQARQFAKGIMRRADRVERELKQSKRA